VAYLSMHLSIRIIVCALLAAVLSASSSASAQQVEKTASASSQQPAPDIVAHETTTFKVRVNQVLMRVVVRDAHGNAVGNLTKDNFQILDNGKPQPIASFSVIQQAFTPAPTEAPTVSQADPEQPIREVAAPEQYFAYVFDDV